MANKPTKPMKVVPPATPTKEELELKRLAYFAQRREGIATNILCSMMKGAITNKDVTNYDCKSLVALSVEMTDSLLEKLYPAPKTEEKK